MTRSVTAQLLGDPLPCLDQRRREAEERASGVRPQIKTVDPKFRPHMKNRGKWS